MKKREFTLISDNENISKILDAYVDKCSFFIKGIKEASRISFSRKNNYIKLNFPNEFKELKTVTIFTMLNNYVEFDLTHFPNDKLKHLYIVQAIRIAKSSRAAKRYDARGYGIRVTKFTNIKSGEDINPKKLPVYVRVILKSYENKYQLTFAPAKLFLDVYNVDTDDEIVKLIKKTNKIVYIRDTINPDTYLKQDDIFISCIKNYRKMFTELDANISEEGRRQLLEELKVEVNKETKVEISKMDESDIKSIIYYPIMYDRNKEIFLEPFPIGYIKLHSEKGARSPYIEESIIETLRQIADETCEAISYGSSKSIDVNDDVLNISLKGLRLILKNDEIINNIINNPTEEYMFTVQFPQLPSLSFWGRVAHYKVLPDRTLDIGMEFLSENRKKELRLRTIATLENYLKHLFEKQSKKESQNG